MKQNIYRGPINFLTMSYNNAYASSPEDYLRLDPRKEPQSMYKFEFGGLLVYDSRALITKNTEKKTEILESAEEKPRVVINKKDIIKSDLSGI